MRFGLAVATVLVVVFGLFTLWSALTMQAHGGPAMPFGVDYGTALLTAALAASAIGVLWIRQITGEVGE